MPHVTAIIPARLEGRRFPRKVLFPIGGRPMIYHIWKGARRAKMINRLFVATDSEELGQVVNDFGGSVIMTSNRPANGSERTAEAVRNMKTDLIINIQADNFGLTGSLLDRIVTKIVADKKVEFATVARRITGRGWKEKLYNPNVVKTVFDQNGQAAWFSRYPIPFVQKKSRQSDVTRFDFWEHLGIYFYSKKGLEKYANWPVGTAEKAESLEQLRILENGGKISLYPTRSKIISVDSKEDVPLV